MIDANLAFLNTESKRNERGIQAKPARCFYRTHPQQPAHDFDAQASPREQGWVDEAQGGGGGGLT